MGENSDISQMLALLHELQGIDFIRQLRLITKGFRTADFIFERKGVYKMFDLKTIFGKTSVSSRLIESIGQTNHVVLNMATDYEARLLAKDIQTYFEASKDAREVLIMKGSKFLSVSRRFVEGKDYIKMFMKRYLK